MTAQQLPAVEAFRSILFDRADRTPPVGQLEEPDFFPDLNLDQVVDSVTAGRDEYDLKPFFYAPLPTVDAITYRHEVLRDLQRTDVLDGINAFARQMQSMRKHLEQTDKLHYRYQKQAWFLDAVQVYCDAVQKLANHLDQVQPNSRGLVGLGHHLTHYTSSDEFNGLCSDTARVRQQLAEVRYCVHVRGNRVKVTNYQGEADYSDEVLATFEKFKHATAKDRRVELSDAVHMNHVEATVLNGVAQLNPEPFAALHDYCRRHADYLDRTVATFDREVQFYIAVLEYLNKFKRTELRFCYPQVCDDSKEMRAQETFDLALANKPAGHESPIVCNDFYLTGPERIFVVSGPNQGGKTTFARTFGQLHYLASIGCLVPGREVQLPLFDQLFTHFEKEEELTDLRGKLQDDLVRIHEILERATSDSVIVMNEIFTSTTLEDARFLGTKVLEDVIGLGALCVCVTFVDELASLSEAIVSMTSMVVPEDPALRTYKIQRRPADGLAYAVAIAEKYGLTYERLRERIGP